MLKSLPGSNLETVSLMCPDGTVRIQGNYAFYHIMCQHLLLALVFFFFTTICF